MRIRNLVGCLLMTLGLSLAALPAATAAEEGPTVVTAEVVSTPDNECPPWARDTFTRTTTITELKDLGPFNEYQIRIDDNGTFLAESGVEGTIDGYVEYLVHGNLKPDQIEDLDGKSYDYSGLACKGDASELPTTSEWALQYFGKHAEAKGITDWKYIYETPCQIHIEKSGAEAVGAETFKLCVTPEEPEFTHPVCEKVDGEETTKPGLAAIPEVEGIEYDPAEDQELSHGDKIKVRASALDGFVIPEDADRKWSFLAVTVPCSGDDGKDGKDGDDGESVIVEDDVEQTSAKGAALPKTGASPWTIAGVGIVILLAGGAMFVRGRMNLARR